VEAGDVVDGEFRRAVGLDGVGGRGVEDARGGVVEELLVDGLPVGGGVAGRVGGVGGPARHPPLGGGGGGGRGGGGTGGEGRGRGGGGGGAKGRKRRGWGVGDRVMPLPRGWVWTIAPLWGRRRRTTRAGVRASGGR